MVFLLDQLAVSISDVIWATQASLHQRLLKSLAHALVGFSQAQDDLGLMTDAINVRAERTVDIVDALKELDTFRQDPETQLNSIVLDSKRLNADTSSMLERMSILTGLLQTEQSAPGARESVENLRSEFEMFVRQIEGLALKIVGFANLRNSPSDSLH